MIDPLCIAEPSQLADNSTKLAALDLSGKPRQITLILLQPLINVNTISSCLHEQPSGPLKWQYLDIKTLSQAWRKAVIEAKPTPNLVFDLSLPELTDICSSSDDAASVSGPHKLFWDTDSNYEKHHNAVVIRSRDFLTMVNSIALAVRMRCEGTLSFRIVCNEKQGLLKQVVDVMERHLVATEKDYRDIVPGKVEEQGKGKDSQQFESGEISKLTDEKKEG